MSSNLEFVNYVCEAISDAGEISFKKMFGEYGIYCNGVMVGSVCDNQFFLKKTEVGERLINEPQLAPPYPGAKLAYLIEDLEDSEFLGILVHKSYLELSEKNKGKKDGKGV